MTDEDILYYESHVTIEPVFEDELTYVQIVIAPNYGLEVWR